MKRSPNLKKILKLCIATAGIVGMLAGCGTKNGTAAGTDTGTGTDTETGASSESLTDSGKNSTADSATGNTTSDAVKKEVSDGMNHFALQLFDQLNQGDNLFFSPYSVEMALSMVDNGAGSETKTEMENLLGITDLNQWNIQIQQLKNSFTDEKAVLNTGNSVWLSKNLTLAENAEKDFFTPLGTYYNADAYQVDFAQTKTVELINKWVSDKTEGMIDPFLTALSPDLSMCLVNAVYFDGEWQTKFVMDNTNQQTFYGKSGEKQTDMMHLSDEYFKYAETEKLTGIELPYGSGDVVMDVWLPKDKETSSITDVLASMTSEEKLDLMNQMDNAQQVEINTLSMPKFEMESDLMVLNDALIKCGMVKAFDSNSADFGKIANSLFIDQVVHKAKIEVDENGTRAAAASGVTMDTTSVMVDENIINFNVDHPFYYCIRDTKSGVILFMGVMQDIL